MGVKDQRTRPEFVIGPLGERLTLETLPPADTTHWVMRRKAQVVAGINGGLLSIAEAFELYGLTVEEFSEWKRAVDRAGLPGLRVTKACQRRKADP